MKRLLPLVFLLIWIVSVPQVQGQGQGILNYYGIEDIIHDDLSVTNIVTLEFNQSITHLDYQLNFDIVNLVAESDFESADCEIQDQRTISCDFIGITPEKNQLILSFKTVDGVKQVDNHLVFNVNYGFLPTENAFVLIRLPQYSVLSGDNPAESYFPEDGKIISDGKVIAVFWEFNDVGDETLQFSVSYLPPLQIPSELIVALTILVIVVMVGVVVFARRRSHLGEVITSVLNTDENVIVNILKKNDGKALQKVLVRDSDFSKAKISRLVKDLKSRGVLEIEPVSGRENRILLSMGKVKKDLSPGANSPDEAAEKSE